MKWYKAIALTVALLFVTGLADALLGGTGAIVSLMVGISAIWVGVHSGSLAWGIGVFLLWLIVFPWFLIKEYEPSSAVPAGISDPRLEYEPSQRSGVDRFGPL
jgi:hypothetical protein